MMSWTCHISHELPTSQILLGEEINPARLSTLQTSLKKCILKRTKSPFQVEHLYGNAFKYTGSDV